MQAEIWLPGSRHIFSGFLQVLSKAQRYTACATCLQVPQMHVQPSERPSETQSFLLLQAVAADLKLCQCMPKCGFLEVAGHVRHVQSIGWSQGGVSSKQGQELALMLSIKGPRQSCVM